MKQTYSEPKLTVLGTAADVTRDFNKVGGASDQYSSQIEGLVGSIVPLP